MAQILPTSLPPAVLVIVLMLFHYEPVSLPRTQDGCFWYMVEPPPLAAEVFHV